MKRLAFSSAILLLVVAAVPAQETPESQLEFIRKLRAKGYADLALEHIEKLKKTNPAMSQALAVEAARANVTLAKQKEPDQRPALYNVARVTLEAAVAKTSGPEAAQGRLELANLAALQGQAILSKALRLDDTKTQQEVARKAETQFIAAGQQLEAAAKLLTQAAKAYKNPDAQIEGTIKKELANDALQARFDLAINYIDQARTYIDLANEALNLKRATIVDEARKIFEKIAADEDAKLALLAKAWLVKCYQEGQNPQLATKYYKLVVGESGKVAQPAQRWARLFYMQGLLIDPQNKAKPLVKVRQIQKEGQDWLKDYPAHKNSPEGQAVRYELALAYFREAQIVSPKDATAAAAAKLYTMAQSQLSDLADSDSDYAEKANQLNLDISFIRMGEKTPIAQLKDFDQCFLKAQFAMSQARQTAGKIDSAKPGEAEKLEEKRKGHLNEMVTALNRGFELANAKTSRNKLAEARYLLTVAHLLSGDLQQAAKAGEALAREWPNARRAPTAAGYALEAYANLANQDPAARDGLRNLASYILTPESQKRWQGDPVIPVAMYHLASSYRQDNDPKKMIALLEKLPADFSGYVYAQGQLLFAALDARDKAGSPEDRKFFEDKARKAVARIPTLPAGADPSTAAMYFYAQLEQAKFLYADGVAELGKRDLQSASRKFIDMAKFTESLQTQFDKSPIKLTSDTTEKIRSYLSGMQKYALLGQVDTDYRAGNYDKIIQMLSKSSAGQKFSVMEEVKLRSKDGKIRMKDYKVTAELLGIALRAQVQKGKIDEAKKILNNLKQLTGEEEDLIADPTATLRALVTELEVQVKDLKKSGDSLRLKTTVANFSAFLDELAKGADKKTMEAKDYLFLANCYDSINQHVKAAKLYAEITPPAAINKVGEKLSDEEEQKLQTYWYAQIKLAEQQRLANELKESQKTLARLLEHPNKRMTMLADKQMLHLLEAQELWGAAATRWGQFRNNPALRAKLADDSALRKLFFEAYYHETYCLYKFSQTPKGKPKEAGYLKTAANNVLRLEKDRDPANPNEPGEGWQILGPRFRELLASEEPLRKVYEELKRK